MTEQTDARLQEIQDLPLTEAAVDSYDIAAMAGWHVGRLSRELRQTCFVALSEPSNAHFRVWLADEAGQVSQRRWPATDAGLGPFIAADRPQLLIKLQRPAAELVRSEIWQIARENVFSAPLAMPTEAVSLGRYGLVGVLESSPRVEPKLEAFAELFSVLLDRAALHEQLVLREQEFDALTQISLALSGTLSLERVYQLLAGTIKELLNVETLSVGRVELVTGDIVFAPQLLGPEFAGMPEIRLDRGQGIAGWVAEHGEPIIINDTYSDQRFFAGVDRQSGFRTRSMICIPLQVENRTVGVLQAINRVSGAFADRDLRLLQALGGPLAAAIENAELHLDVVVERSRFEAAADSRADCILTVNRKGSITFANESFCALTGVTPETAPGVAVADLVHLPEQLDWLELLTGVLEHVQSLTDIPAAVGHRERLPSPVSLDIAPIARAGQAADEAVIVMTDLTELAELNRMRDDLYAGIIQELRTPLATILLYARLLNDDSAAKLSDKSLRFLGVIERESDRVHRLVRQMLRLAGLQSREHRHSAQHVDIAEVAGIVLPDATEAAVLKGLVLRHRIEPDLPPVLGNKRDYETVLRQVIDNAIKFTPSGSIRVRVFHAGDTVTIEIEDDGIGIARETLPHVFRKFYRGRAAVDYGLAGTGLSLFMVKEIVDYYNGSIAIASEPGEGTTVTIRLPADQ